MSVASHGMRILCNELGCFRHRKDRLPADALMRIQEQGNETRTRGRPRGRVGEPIIKPAAWGEFRQLTSARCCLGVAGCLGPSWFCRDCGPQGRGRSLGKRSQSDITPYGSSAEDTVTYDLLCSSQQRYRRSWLPAVAQCSSVGKESGLDGSSASGRMWDEAAPRASM